MSDTHRREDPGSWIASLPRLVDAACIGELAWVAPGGPDAMAVTPLRLGDRPAVAVPYAFAERLHEAGTAPWVAMALTDSRMTSRGWNPTVLTGRPVLREDLGGDVFAEQLLAQEVRKCPPARAYADTPLLRSENWWYLPRVILTLDVDEVASAHARTMPGDDGVLVTSRFGRPVLEVVTVPDWSLDPLPLQVEGGGPARGEGPAALLAHNFSVPDLERGVQRLTRGHVEEGRLRVDGGAPGPLELPPTPRLWERIQRHRTLERACRRGINVAEHSQGG